MKKIQIITSLERTPVERLQGMTQVSATSVRLLPGISWQSLKIKPHAQLSISDKVEDGNTVWTDAQVDAALKKDLKKFEGFVLEYVNIPLTQNQFDALVGFPDDDQSAA